MRWGPGLLFLVGVNGFLGAAGGWWLELQNGYILAPEGWFQTAVFLGVVAAALGLYWGGVELGLLFLGAEVVLGILAGWYFGWLNGFILPSADFMRAVILVGILFAFWGINQARPQAQ